MKHGLVTVLIVPLLAGCALLPERMQRPAPSAETASGQTRPVARPDAPAERSPRAGARTAEALDTSSAEERATASEPATPEMRDLGRTVASLGDPARSGFWLETPLVRSAATGRVEYQGKSARVDLIPIDGPPSGGSRLSLAAMRLVGAPLTGLPTVAVFADN
ncbi:hypothetical protein M8756_02745 [Lutimaribacter sp. EGI FJ00015]|uniref:Uncharacterized protein n=1 Tax=Lutimaribacter degradans TaxID=2945989 RepID=A0ACC5ZSU1_9RHOB|nr:hypothetical protein [Lutimaribacter sp. EGI FJ00013]MCM2560841.1 hypothetical protein [Lutimaribacter sp. EGI FJ00013]MCO0612214.1 hypothetical protein [Lutimaribacter sp. EGI FJ00015]MCO0634666.1 hypothetical protein [Lutimaribacter sp. EGI FJ00014]